MCIKAYSHYSGAKHYLLSAKVLLSKNVRGLGSESDAIQEAEIVAMVLR